TLAGWQTQHVGVVGDEHVALRVNRDGVDDVVWSKRSVEELALAAEGVEVTGRDAEDVDVGVERARCRAGWRAATRNGRASHVDLVCAVCGHTTRTAHVQDLERVAPAWCAGLGISELVQTAVVTDVQVGLGW